MKGRVYKRCACPAESAWLWRGNEATGKLERMNCPRKHGVWYYQHDLPPAADGRRRQVKRGGHATEKEAQKALTAAVARVDRGVHVDRTKLSVATWLEQWLEGKVNLRPATRLYYRTVVDGYLIPYIGHLRLSDLRADDVERMFSKIRKSPDRRGNPASAALVLRVRATLRASLNTAVRRQLIFRNPVDLVEVEAHRRPEVKVWDGPTTGRFLHATADTWQGPLWHLIASFGLRRGEAAGLTWAHVDLEAGTARILRARTQVGGKVYEGGPKTARGDRTLSLDSGTIAVLRAYRAAQRAKRLALGPAWVDSGLVFTMEDGRPIQPQLITRWFAAACKDGSLPHIRLHDLRHTSAALGEAAGESLLEVSRRLGHSNIAITADTYGHIFQAGALASSERRAGVIPRAMSLQSTSGGA